MITPPMQGRLTSGYGMRGGTLHDGQDIAAPSGTPIRAAWPGRVMKSEFHAGWGWQVVLDHGPLPESANRRTLTRYAHMRDKPLVSVGQWAEVTQQIGVEGSTGSSTGPHLHFGVYRGDEPNYSTSTDPAPYLRAREAATMALNPMRGADWSRARPTKAQLDRDGISFCVRYILDGDRDQGKRLTLSEARTLTSWGRRLVCNFEYTTGGMLGGYAQGVKDAQTSLAELRVLGVPAGRPVYFSDDQGGTPAAAVLGYLNGASSVLGKSRVGVYGGRATITTAANAGYRWLWQTYAWSGTPPVWHPATTIRQIQNNAFSGWSGDLCIATAADFGQWDTTGWIPSQEEDSMPETVRLSFNDAAGNRVTAGPLSWDTVMSLVMERLVKIDDGDAETIKADLAELAAELQEPRPIEMTAEQMEQLVAALIAADNPLTPADLDGVREAVKGALRQGTE